MDEIELKVAEAMQIDYGKRVVRLDSNARRLLNLTTGDVIQIAAKKTTAALVLPAHPQDEGLNIIRMDGILRQNTNVALGDRVKVKKAEIRTAKKIVLAPNQNSRYAPGFDTYVKKNLIGKPLSKGDILSVNIFGTSFPFVVAQTVPNGLLLVAPETEVILKEEPVKELGKLNTISYEDIGGLKDTVQKIREMVELPMRHPELFERLGIEPPKGVLIYGPPGTGKTLLARAVASESDAHFITINGPEVVSKFVGEAEERLRGIFQEAEENAPAIIFIDEIDSIAPKREEVVGEVEKRIVSQLLCVAPETPIYAETGVSTIEKIYETDSSQAVLKDGIEYKHPEHLAVNALDKNGQIQPTRVMAMNKLFVPDAFEIRLQNGATLKTSAIQRFCTLTQGKLDWIPITELQSGDYVGVPTQIHFQRQEHDLIQKLKADYSLKLSKELKSAFGRAVVNKSEFEHFIEYGDLLEDGTLRTRILNYVRKQKECTLDDLIQTFQSTPNQKVNLRRLLKSLTQIGSIDIQTKSRKIIGIRATPVMMPTWHGVEGISVFRYFQRYVKDSYFVKPLRVMSTELAELMGYVMADGCLSKNRLNITGSPEMVEQASQIVQKLFGKTGKITKYERFCRLDVACQTIPFVLHDVFELPIGKKAFTLRLPSFMYTMGQDEIRAFIRAYFDCDASLGTNLRAFSRSKQMMQDLSALLHSVGFQTSYTYSNGMHYCNILGGTNTMIRYSEEIGSVRYDRLKKFQDLMGARHVRSSIQFVPNMQEAFNALRSGFEGLSDNDYRYLNGNRAMGSDKAKYFVGLYKGKATQAVENLNQLLQAQVSWTKIESIRKIDGMVMYDLTTETENFVGGNVPTLLHNTLMDGLKARGSVVVIGATNRQNSIDPALRRPGRFDREIEIGVPDKKGRKEILQIHTRGMPLNKDISLDEIAGQTHGFVGADLHALVKEGAMKALRRMLPKMNLEDEQIPAKILEELKVTRDDVQNALREIQPSALREVYVEVPNVQWNDIGGLEDVKREIREAVEMPLKKPEVFKRMGIRPVRGILLYGPPGTGKTLLAKAVATESEANFISIKGPEILSKWVGEAEKSVREIFRKARQVAPTVIFIDELDSIAQTRGSDEGSGVGARVVDSLLTEMDGLKNIKDVVVIGATNRIDIIDPALLRPGRFDKLIEIAAPDVETRLAILKVHTAPMPIASKVDLQKIAGLTEGFSGADLEGLCREAAMIALRENLAVKFVEPVHFEKALASLSPVLMKKREREKDLQYA